MVTPAAGYITPKGALLLGALAGAAVGHLVVDAVKANQKKNGPKQ